MAQAKKAADAESAAEKFGRALIDIAAHDLKSGDYATLPAAEADALAAIGAFDINAIEVQE
jgi:hypothetical protein